MVTLNFEKINYSFTSILTETVDVVEIERVYIDLLDKKLGKSVKMPSLIAKYQKNWRESNFYRDPRHIRKPVTAIRFAYYLRSMAVSTVVPFTQRADEDIEYFRYKNRRYVATPHVLSVNISDYLNDRLRMLANRYATGSQTKAAKSEFYNHISNSVHSCFRNGEIVNADTITSKVTAYAILDLVKASNLENVNQS